ncbi:MAG: ATP-binding protein [Gemmatimonadota bacterium]
MGSKMESSGDEPTAPGLLESVLDNLIEGLQIIGPDYRYLYLNGAAARHGRSTREALVGRTMMEAYPGIDTTEMFGTLRRCLENQTPAMMENAFVFLDGSLGWFELRFQPIPEGVVILSVDITDRKQAEITLGRSMRALHTLSRSNQTLVRAVDEDTLVREVARIVVDTGGYPMAWIGLAESEGGRRVRRVAAAVPRGAPDEAALARLAESRGVASLVDRVLGAARGEVVRFVAETQEDGRELWEEAVRAHGFASCLVLPVPAQEGQLGVLVIYANEPDAFDETELGVLNEVALDLGYGLDALATRAGEADARVELDEVRGKSRAIFDHLPHATLVWRRGEGRLTLIDFNEAARHFFKGSPLRRGVQAAAVASLIPDLEADLTQCLNDRGAVRREVDCPVAGASEPARLALTYELIPPNYVILHAQDVTRERLTEARLVASERLEAVGRLAGGVAHDFNNLLSVILTSAEFALTQLDASSPIRDDIEQVQTAGRKAAALTKQLLAFGRRQLLEPQVTDLNRVLSGLGDMLHRVLAGDIELTIHPARDLGSVMADAGQLERVLVNLALNARDAMPRGGKLTIETANAELDGQEEYPVEVPPGRYVCVSVTDSGIGMAPDVRDRVFEPFFTTKAGGKGTGLGLSSVYGIVKQSDGFIWVYSEIGQGTTFKVYLPRVDTPVVEPKPAPPPAPAIGGETVLIAEDEDGVRRASERILRAVGFRVLTASNGPEAIKLCAELTDVIHLLLTDVVMPGMNGPELASRLRVARPGVKILFMSGYADKAVGQHGILDGGSHFISKPFTVDELRRKVREVLDGA